LEFVQANDISGLIKSKIFKEKTAKKFWAEIEGHRVYLSTRYPVKRGREKELTGVVMGGCGNGKTSLLNNICLSKLPIGESMHSKTRNITWERVQFLKSGKFIIYDTPGTTSDQETSLHATLLRTTLTYKPINVVFLQVKYERRGIDFIKDMYVQSQVI
jgi:predicted GTPase